MYFKNPVLALSYINNNSILEIWRLLETWCRWLISIVLMHCAACSKRVDNCWPRVQLAWYPSQTLSTQRTLHLTSALTQPIVADRPSALRSNHVCSGITSGSAQPTTAHHRKNQHLILNLLFEKTTRIRAVIDSLTIWPARPIVKFHYSIYWACCVKQYWLFLVSGTIYTWWPNKKLTIFWVIISKQKQTRNGPNCTDNHENAHKND